MYCFLNHCYLTRMEACERCEKITDKEEIENTPNSARSDQCAEDGDSLGVLKNAEIIGLDFDKCPVGLAMASEEVSRTRVNMSSAPDSRLPNETNAIRLPYHILTIHHGLSIHQIIAHSKFITQEDSVLG